LSLFSEEKVSRLQNSDKENLVNYFLGELSEPDRHEIEERGFIDDDYFSEMLSAEDDLVEKYLKGELSSKQTARFELHFLASPRRRERVNIANALNYTIKESVAAPVSELKAQKTVSSKLKEFFNSIFEPKRGRRLAFATAAAVILFGASWLWWQRYLLSREVSLFEQESASLRNQQEKSRDQVTAAQQRVQVLDEELQTERRLRAELEEQTIELQRQNEHLKRNRSEIEAAAPSKTPSGQTPDSVITFVLTPGLIRDVGGEKNLRLPANVRTVIFNINLQRNEYSDYQISLQTPEGRELWKRDDLTPRETRSGSILAFPIPAKLLNKGVHILALSGQNATNKPELINQYVFNVFAK
jgi:hypothetical protein